MQHAGRAAAGLCCLGLPPAACCRACAGAGEFSHVRFKQQQCPDTAASTPGDPHLPTDSTQINLAATATGLYHSVKATMFDQVIRTASLASHGLRGTQVGDAAAGWSLRPQAGLLPLLQQQHLVMVSSCQRQGSAWQCSPPCIRQGQFSKLHRCTAASWAGTAHTIMRLLSMVW